MGDGITTWKELAPVLYASECTPVQNNTHQGTTPPKDTTQFWVDTTDHTLKYFNTQRKEWISIESYSYMRLFDENGYIKLTGIRIV